MLSQIILISIIIVLVSFLLLGFNIFLLKKKFPETSVGHNIKMMKMGIKCARCEEISSFRNREKKYKFNPDELKMSTD